MRWFVYFLNFWVASFLPNQLETKVLLMLFLCMLVSVRACVDEVRLE